MSHGEEGDGGHGPTTAHGPPAHGAPAPAGALITPQSASQQQGAASGAAGAAAHQPAAGAAPAPGPAAPGQPPVLAQHCWSTAFDYNSRRWCACDRVASFMRTGRRAGWLAARAPRLPLPRLPLALQRAHLQATWKLKFSSRLSMQVLLQHSNRAAAVGSPARVGAPTHRPLAPADAAPSPSARCGRGCTRGCSPPPCPCLPAAWRRAGSRAAAAFASGRWGRQQQHRAAEHQRRLWRNRGGCAPGCTRSRPCSGSGSSERTHFRGAGLLLPRCARQHAGRVALHLAPPPCLY